MKKIAIGNMNCFNDKSFTEHDISGGQCPPYMSASVSVSQPSLRNLIYPTFGKPLLNVLIGAAGQNTPQFLLVTTFG